MQTQQQRPTLLLQSIIAGLSDICTQLDRLDWQYPLTRDDIRQQWEDFPMYVYLHLPAARRFTTTADVRRLLIRAKLRAGSDSVEAEIPDEGMVRTHGGPPAWGPDPLIAGVSQESGSATDIEQHG